MIKIKPLPSQAVDFDNIIEQFNQVKGNLFGTIGRRQQYLWDWVYLAADLTKMDWRDKNRNEQLDIIANSAKTLGVMWDVLVDDIADDFPIERAKKLLPCILSEEKQFNEFSTEEKDYVEFCDFIMHTVFTLLEQLPGYAKHKKGIIVEYDGVKKNFRYSLQVREYFDDIRLTQYIDFLSNNMHMLVNGAIDLAKLDYPDTFLDHNKLRSIFRTGQRMGRIGNSVTTYQYEVPRGDLSSEIIAFALTYHLLDEADLSDPKHVMQILEQLDIEGLYWQIWERYKLKLSGLIEVFPQLDINTYISGLEQLRELHLQSRGKK